MGMYKNEGKAHICCKTGYFRTVYGVNRDPFQPILSDVELRIVLSCLTWRRYRCRSLICVFRKHQITIMATFFIG